MIGGILNPLYLVLFLKKIYINDLNFEKIYILLEEFFFNAFFIQKNISFFIRSIFFE